MRKHFPTPWTLLLVCAASWAALEQPGWAQGVQTSGTARGDVERLQAQLVSQQQQINELRALLDAQQKLLERALPGVVTAPAPPSPPERAAVPAPAAHDEAPAAAPLSLQLGGIAFTPTGFFEYSQIWRSKMVSSGLPTNFAGVPFADTVEGHRRQTLSTAGNTRLGVQVDTKAQGFTVLGVVETDFLGYQPGNVATTTNSSGLRLRLAFVDARKNKWEVFGGQTWSLLTPGRTGISPLPANLFLTEDLDPNLQSGMFWGRTPQVRVVFRPKARVALGMSFESGDVYAGGSGGSVSVTLPGALAPNYFGQIDTGTSAASVPSPNSDFIAKLAFDPKVSDRAMHVEVAGLVNRAAFYNPLNGQAFSAIGGGVAVNAGIEAVPHLTLYTNNFYTHGGGRFIFGEAPNLIIQGDGAPSLVRATSTVDGLEFQMGPRWKVSAYYGGTFIDQAVTTDPATGGPVGYGYPGAPSGQNRSIQEVTGGFTRILWQNPNYGAFRFSGQYSWLTRRPWSVAPGQPASTSLHMLYLTFRYVLPGAPAPKQ